GLPRARGSRARTLHYHRCRRAKEDGRQIHIASRERTARTGAGAAQLRRCGFMSPQASELDEAPPPRMTQTLFGHAGTEAALFTAYRGGRVPHAFLLIGQKGIGKATLA